MDDCHICGDCWWVKCGQPADFSIDVDLKRRGTLIYSGNVDLCAGHEAFVRMNGGRLDLEPLAIEQANAIKTMRVTR